MYMVSVQEFTRLAGWAISPSKFKFERVSSGGIAIPSILPETVIKIKN